MEKINLRFSTRFTESLQAFAEGRGTAEVAGVQELQELQNEKIGIVPGT
jgi:hypothetical protein